MLHQYNIHALHGFLGTPQDWLPIQDGLGYHFESHSLFHNDDSILSFNEWTEKFNCKVKSANRLPNNILMGYSLGGRLGLHALLQQPEIWKGAILVSTHSGLKSQEDRQSRIVSDETWAARFESESWDELMQAWNAQGVFKHDPSMHRKETDHERRKLAAALRIWSLGIQDDLTNRIAELDIPLLWMVGENDAKFLEVAKRLKFKHPKSRMCVVQNAGHRLLFEQTETYKQSVTQFIMNLQEKGT